MSINIDDFCQLFPSIVDHIEPNQVSVLLQKLNHVDLTKDQVIVTEGEQLDTTYFVWSGILNLSVEHYNGNIVDAGHVTPGGWIGDLSIVAPGPAVATFTATNNTILLALSEKAFQELQQEQPVLASRLVMALSQHLAHRLRAPGKLLFKRFAWDQVEGAAGEDSVKEWFTKIYRQLLGSGGAIA